MEHRSIRASVWAKRPRPAAAAATLYLFGMPRLTSLTLHWSTPPSSRTTTYNTYLVRSFDQTIPKGSANGKRRDGLFAVRFIPSAVAVRPTARYQPHRGAEVVWRISCSSSFAPPRERRGRLLADASHAGPAPTGKARAASNSRAVSAAGHCHQRCDAGASLQNFRAGDNSESGPC